MYNKKPTGRALTIPGGIAQGVTLSMIVTMLSCTILAWMVDTEKLPWEKIGYGIMVVLLLSSFLGAMLSFQKTKRQRLLVCLLSGFVYFGILLSLTALFFGGQYEAVGVTAALILAGSGSAGILGVKPAERRKHPKIRKRSR